MSKGPKKRAGQIEKLAGDIRKLESELANRRAELLTGFPEKHEGPEYVSALMAFHAGLADMAQQHQRHFVRLEERITDLRPTPRRDWVHDTDIVKLWMLTAHALAKTGGHPKTGIGSYIINSRNEVVAKASNGLPDDMEVDPHILENGGRRRNVWFCAERKAMRSVMDIPLPEIDEKSFSHIKRPGKRASHIARERIVQLNKAIAEKARDFQPFRQSVMITTVCSCNHCAKPMVAAGFRGIITNGFKAPTGLGRGLSVEKANKLFCDTRVPVLSMDGERLVKHHGDIHFMPEGPKHREKGHGASFAISPDPL